MEVTLHGGFNGDHSWEIEDTDIEKIKKMDDLMEKAFGDKKNGR